MIRHLAAIMDGNRRWALNNKLSLAAGYGHGGKRALQEIIKFCLEYKISYLSLYAFSLENFDRSLEERSVVFSTLLQEVKNKQEELIQQSIAIRFVGKLELLPVDVQAACAALEKATEKGTRLSVALLICYGGQQEIINAARLLVQEQQVNSMTSEQEFKELFEKALWTYPFPAPDLIIRTGGMKRLSNFLTYQSAYTELLFLDILWPDLTFQDCQNAYNTFCSIKRNFGK